MAGDLEGKVALISGGARGMGAAEARLFVAEGGRVVIGDVLDDEGKATAAAIGDSAHYVHLDVTQEADWQSVVAETEARFGRLDVLVNNAGVLRFGLLEDTELADYEFVIRINQIGVFLGMKSVVAAMRRAGGGSIVNISSMAGLRGIGGALAYTASKFAVRGMTKVAAIELGSSNIRVNSVHPGGVEDADGGIYGGRRSGSGSQRGQFYVSARTYRPARGSRSARALPRFGEELLLDGR